MKCKIAFALLHFSYISPLAFRFHLYHYGVKILHSYILTFCVIPLRPGQIMHQCMNENEDQMKWKLQRNEGETISPRLGVMGKG